MNNAQENTTLEVAFIGTLAADAVVRQTDGSVVLLEVLLAQAVQRHPQALPLFAAVLWPLADRSFAAAFAAATTHAATLRAGTQAVVRGRGLETGTRHGHAVLRVIQPFGAYPASKLMARALNPELNQSPAHAH